MKSIIDFAQKIKGSLEGMLTRDVLVLVMILTTSFSSFALGRISSLEEKTPPIYFATSTTYTGRLTDPQAAFVALLKDVQTSQQPTETVTTSTEAVNKTIVASKNGKKYYYLWCTGASRISPKNAVFFETASVAESRGYTLASGCKP